MTYKGGPSREHPTFDELLVTAFWDNLDGAARRWGSRVEEKIAACIDALMNHSDQIEKAMQALYSLRRAAFREVCRSFVDAFDTAIREYQERELPLEPNFLPAAAGSAWFQSLIQDVNS